MSTLSANTLFHFTRNKENLISILNSCFYPRLCIEKAFWFDENIDFDWSIPMVCFCDIPLSQIKEHTLKYGEYAIGLTKEWAHKKGLTPVMYTHKDSQLAQSIRSLIYEIDNIAMEFEKNNIEYSREKILKNYLDIASNIKPYEGIIEIKGKAKNVRFYDEREWRYTIPLSNKDISEFIRSIFTLKNKELINNINKSNEQDGLTFEPKYINYVIVPKESEILEIMREVRNIKGHFPYNDIELLTTRIISMERINEDF